MLVIFEANMSSKGKYKKRVRPKFYVKICVTNFIMDLEYFYDISNLTRVGGHELFLKVSNLTLQN